MSVFTIFFCGTGSNSFDFRSGRSGAHVDYYDGELVSTLAYHHAGSEFVDWAIVDGPGSGNLQEDQKWVKPGNHSQWFGQLTGAGWENNVQHAMALVKGESEWQRDELTKRDARVLRKAREDASPEDRSRLPEVKKGGARLVTPQQLQQRKVQIMRKRDLSAINLVGWSRGGVTCHMMANALREDPETARIPVRIFANDPVPGVGQFRARRTILGDNVEEYIAVYSRDERSFGFMPIIPQLARRTRRTILSMPGRHATLVGNASNYGDAPNRFREPGRITRDLAEKALSRWGTPLRERISLSAHELLRLYDKVLADDEAYRGLRGRTYTFAWGGSSRDVAQGTSAWTNPSAPANPVFGSSVTVDFDHAGGLRPDPVFVNSHHRWLFGQVFGGAPGDSATADQVRTIAPTVARRLFA